MTLVQMRLPDAIHKMAEKLPNGLLHYTLHYVTMMDNATPFIVQPPSTLQLMNNTPSSWTSTGLPCIFGHQHNHRNKYVLD